MGIGRFAGRSAHQHLVAIRKAHADRFAAYSRG
jgi:hypothetical protein